MARDRQRARRQAERRARRLEDRRKAQRADGQARAEAVTGDPAEDVMLATGAPPQNTGRSDTVAAHPPLPPDLSPDPDITLDDAWTPDAATPAERHERGRVIGFLVAVWAELKRVEWPDRKALTTMSTVVLVFVIIAGGYLGILDAIFSRLIQAIL
jgi:preprotein translocase subunit SecE